MTTNSDEIKAEGIKRKGFNWQFIGIEPEKDEKENDLKNWNVDKVSEWLKSVSLDSLAEKFVKQDIDGSVVVGLTEDDLKGELETTLEELLKTQKTPVRKGVILPKGFLPQGEPLSASQKELIKFNRYNAGTRAWIARETALSDEELECWDYQARWLLCPVTSEKWFNNGNAILGVGLYHAPRFLSDQEMQRAINDEATATVDKQKKREEKKEKDTSAIETTSWAKNFQVYPAVVSPPSEYIQKLEVDAGEVALGPMQVIIGPAFNIDAYNYGVVGNETLGIQSQKDRGVLSMDQQYNAFNFVYYVLRSNNSYERKICTSRLSFYIDEFHGSRVFPSNIESQLSLFILTKKQCPYPEPKRMHLLASAIKKMIPHVLKAVIMEVVNGRATAVDEIIDYSLRTYLLVHQVSIKLILYYRAAYEHLYASVIRWIQNPFSPASQKEWPDLEELLIGASLVGISWAMLRESFVRKFLHNLLLRTPRKEGSHKQWIEHIFHNHKAAFHTILYEFSFFFTSSRPLVELDRTYTRCAGSLPKSQRDAMKAMVYSVSEVNTMQEAWLRLGMDVPMDDYELTNRIGSFLSHLSSNAFQWSIREVIPTNIRIPEPESLDEPSPSSSRNNNNNNNNKKANLKDLKKERDEQLEAERKNHEGYPDLNNSKELDRYVCNYPKCKKIFKNRDSLFRHLKQMIPPKRMIRGYHQDHFHLNVTDPNALQCGACKMAFGSVNSIHSHYKEKGVPGTWVVSDTVDSTPSPDAPTTTAPSLTSPTTTSPTTTTSTTTSEPAPPAPKPVDPYENIGVCVVCMEKNREVVNVPCGHMICCSGCATKTKLCPMCRAEVKDHVVVYYS